MALIETFGPNHHWLTCEICLGYIAVCMANPPRCGGIDYDENGIAKACSGRKWSEVEKECDEEHKKEIKEYVEKHFNHLKEIYGQVA